MKAARKRERAEVGERALVGARVEGPPERTVAGAARVKAEQTALGKR